jgi:methanethiol S-methyltransferase
LGFFSEGLQGKWREAPLKRYLALVYGFFAYLVFLAVFLYAVGFVGNLWALKSVDRNETAPAAEAFLIDMLLLALFGVQHSVMARPGFKKKWTRIIPKPVERSTFVLISSLVLALVLQQWRPIPEVVWQIENTGGRMLLWGLFWFGWLLMLYCTFAIDHFDLFGLRQVVLYCRGIPYTHVKFKESFPYSHVRHPMMLGFMIAFWATPNMTAGHMLFASAATAYILVGIFLEERDLSGFLGADYREYRKRVPMLVPRWRKKS